MSFASGGTAAGTEAIGDDTHGAGADAQGQFVFLFHNIGSDPVTATVSGLVSAYAYAYTDAYNEAGSGMSRATVSIDGPGLHLMLNIAGIDPAPNVPNEASDSNSGIILPNITYAVSASVTAESSAEPASVYPHSSDYHASADASWGVSVGAAVAPATIAAPTGGGGVSGNWSSIPWKSGGVTTTAPNGSCAYAYLTAQDTASTITLDTDVTLGHIIIDSPASYTIAGTHTLTLECSNGTSVDVVQGSHTISTPVTVNSDLVLGIDGTKLTVTQQMAFASGVTLRKTGSGEAVLKNVRSAGLFIDDGKVTIAADSTSAGRSRVDAFTMSSTGTLDIKDNALIVEHADATDFSTIRARIISGYASGAWTGVGINSSSAAANSHYGVAYATGRTAFDGQTISSDAAIIDYSLNGDCNLDGTVNFDDQVIIAQNYNASGKIWTTGDCTYDGVTNFDDLVKMAQNYNSSGGGIHANIAFSNEFLSDWALARSLVPEPTTLTALMGMGICLVARRRK